MDDKLTKRGWKEKSSPSCSLSDEELHMFGEMGDRYFRSLLKTLWVHWARRGLLDTHGNAGVSPLGDRRLLHSL